jgi:hypothetical protein
MKGVLPSYEKRNAISDMVACVSYRKNGKLTSDLIESR